MKTALRKSLRGARRELSAAEHKRRSVLAARRRGIKVFVPVVVDKRRRVIRFYPLAGKLRRGAYGISVPQLPRHPVAPRWLDLIVLPVVGVDAMGSRLGMGGGFYDRALSFRRYMRVGMGPHLVGLAFDLQRTRERFAEAWDLRLDSVATESGLQRMTANGNNRSGAL